MVKFAYFGKIRLRRRTLNLTRLRSKCMEFVKFNDVERRFMSELYIFVYGLCALINENLKKNFYFQAGLFLVVVFLGFLAFWLQD